MNELFIFIFLFYNWFNWIAKGRGKKWERRIGRWSFLPFDEEKTRVKKICCGFMPFLFFTPPLHGNAVKENTFLISLPASCLTRKEGFFLLKSILKHQPYKETSFSVCIPSWLKYKHFWCWILFVLLKVCSYWILCSLWFVFSSKEINNVCNDFTNFLFPLRGAWGTKIASYVNFILCDGPVFIEVYIFTYVVNLFSLTIILSLH